MLSRRAPVGLVLAAAVGLHHHQAQVAVGPGQPLAVGRGHRRRRARDRGRACAGSSASPRPQASLLSQRVLARGVGPVGDVLAVVAEVGGALAGAGAAGDGQGDALLHRHREQLAAHLHQQAVAVGREVEALQVAARRRGSACGSARGRWAGPPRLRSTSPVAVSQSCRSPARVKTTVPSVPMAGQRASQRVEVGDAGAVAAVGLAAPEVGGAALVAQEVDRAAVPHGDARPGRGRSVICLKSACFGVAHPDVGRRAAAVALPGGALALGDVEGPQSACGSMARRVARPMGACRGSPPSGDDEEHVPVAVGRRRGGCGR